MSDHKDTGEASYSIVDRDRSRWRINGMKGFAVKSNEARSKEQYELKLRISCNGEEKSPLQTAGEDFQGYIKVLAQ